MLKAVFGSVASGAGSALGQEGAKKAFGEEAKAESDGITKVGDILGESIGCDARIAIKAMKEAFKEVKVELEPDFTSLKQSKFLAKIGKVFTNQIFDSEAFGSYLSNKTREVCLLQVANKNLGAALNEVKNIYVRLTTHMLLRNKESREDSDYTLVLFFLLNALEMLMKLLTQDSQYGVADIKAWEKLLISVITAFQKFANDTQHRASKGCRRMELANQLDGDLKGVKKYLDRFKTQIPVDTSALAIQKKAKNLFFELKGFLIGIIVVPYGEATQKKDKAWITERILQIRRVSMVSELNPEKLKQTLIQDKIESSGFGNKKGILFENPFYKRVKKLNNEKSDKSGQMDKRVLYFHLLMFTFEKLGTRENYAIQIKLVEFGGEYKKRKDKFKLLRDLVFKVDKEVKEEEHEDQKRNEKEWKFITACIETLHISFELVRFLCVLTEFMKLVGIIGLYNETQLHRELMFVVEAASDRLKNHGGFLEECVSGGLVGAWMGPVSEMLAEVRAMIGSINEDFGEFISAFKRIGSDKDHLEKEFNSQIDSLLEATIGLGKASVLPDEKLKKLQEVIKGTTFQRFVIIHEHDAHKAEMQLLEHLVDTQRSVAKQDEDLEQCRVQMKEMEKQIETLEQNNSKISEDVKKMGEDFKQLDDALKAYVDDFNRKFEKIKKDIEADQREIDKKIDQLKKEFAGEEKEVGPQANNRDVSFSSLGVIIEIKGKFSVYLGMILELKEGLNEYCEKYKKVRSTIDVSLHRIDKLLAEIYAVISSLKGRIKILEEFIGLFQKRLDDASREIAARDKKIAEMERALEKQKMASPEAKEEKISELENSTKVIREDLPKESQTLRLCQVEIRTPKERECNPGFNFSSLLSFFGFLSRKPFDDKKLSNKKSTAREVEMISRRLN